MANMLMPVFNLLSTITDPFSCETKGPATHFYLQNSQGVHEITDGFRLKPNASTYFIVHGWQSSHNVTLIKSLGENLYFKTKQNVILVSYKQIAKKFYSCAWTIADKVGKSVSNFIVKQIRAGRMSHDNIHMIAHSLGCHVAGYAARLVTKETGQQIKRISALDPAGPLFRLPITKLTLNSNDAEMVDVLHTTALLGSITLFGKVDFYLGYYPMAPSSCPLFAVLTAEQCAHTLGLLLFEESISSCGISGFSLPSIWSFKSKEVVYGLHMPIKTRGVYTLKLNDKKPYGRRSKIC